MLRIINLENIESLLLRVPAIIQRFDERDPGFISAVNEWLVNTEKVLNENRLTTAAEVSVLRGTLLAYERGSGKDPESQKIVTRKMKEARAAAVLKEATQVTSEAIRLRRAQVNEAERIMSQIVAAAYQLGVIPAETGQDHTAYLLAVKQTLSNRTELVSLVVHVLGLVGNVDFLILVDRAIAAWEQT
jgi:transcriptional repressor TraM